MTSLSTLATFDDIRRCSSILMDGSTEFHFLQFLQEYQQMRAQSSNALLEAQRLQKELDNSLQTIVELERKLSHARKLLESETKSRKEIQSECEGLDKKMRFVREILRQDHNMKEETRDKLAFLNNTPRSRKSVTSRFSRQYANEVNSTGSILSELSVTQSEDDFLEEKENRHRKPYRTSHSASIMGRRSQRMSADRFGGKTELDKNKLEIGPNDKIVAHTRVSIPQGDGPIEAESVIEAVPPSDGTETVTTYGRQGKRKSATVLTPSAPPLSEVLSANLGPTTPKRRSFIKPHCFGNGTFIVSDLCAHCQKKIRFGTMAVKCLDCNIRLHKACKDDVTFACVPSSSSTKIVPTKNVPVLGDFAPSTGPMVPALIVHCVNEIETRGLKETGLYRVNGSERDVKALKERFLSDKNLPNLQSVDINVICGCIKDFLRSSLREPLIPTSMWKDFSNAVQNVNAEYGQKELYAAINALPQANRDTIAFLIQHFQRIAQCKEVKMPVQNLARVFGPTIVGYSCSDLEQHALFAETGIQVAVMEKLLSIKTEYWSQFLDIEPLTTGREQTGRTCEKKGTLRGGYLVGVDTPVMTSKRRDRKYFDTPPYSSRK